MQDIICYSVEDYHATSARLLAERNARRGDNRRIGVPADYLVEVNDEDHSLIVMPVTDLIMDAREAGIFMQHMNAAAEAMRIGAPYFVAVFFTGGEA